MQLYNERRRCLRPHAEATGLILCGTEISGHIGAGFVGKTVWFGGDGLLECPRLDTLSAENHELRRQLDAVKSDFAESHFDHC